MLKLKLVVSIEDLLNIYIDKYKKIETCIRLQTPCPSQSSQSLKGNTQKDE